MFPSRLLIWEHRLPAPAWVIDSRDALSSHPPRCKPIEEDSIAFHKLICMAPRSCTAPVWSCMTPWGTWSMCVWPPFTQPATSSAHNPPAPSLYHNCLHVQIPLLASENSREYSVLYTLNNDFSGRFDVSGILKADMFTRVQAYINSQKFIDNLPLIYSSSTPLLQSERAEAQGNTCSCTYRLYQLYLFLFSQSILYLV